MGESTGMILIVDDDRIQTRLLASWLEGEGYRVHTASDGRAGLEAAQECMPDVVCLDMHMPRMGGMEALECLQRLDPNLPVVMLTADESVEAVVKAMQLGAFDYVTKPVDRTRLASVMRHALQSYQLKLRVRALERAAGASSGYPEIMTGAEQMQRLFDQLDRLVHSDITVLIWGESGTGKELVAHAMHEHGARREGPFVAVNCAAIPESLQEAAFFGHEKGAFTGASERRPGHFERADGGTLFLDEVVELTPAQQAALLRALQESRVVRVGGQQAVEVDVRVVAASNRRLGEAVADGEFREDLYYRLAVYELELPPLRERSGDVTLLARHFLERFAAKEGRPGLDLSDEAIAALLAHDWPGNVRELRNAIQRAVVSADEHITLDDLPPAVRRAHREVGAPASRRISQEVPVLPLHELERRAILGAFEETDGNVSEVARLLGISRATLYRKFKQYGLDPSQERD